MFASQWLNSKCFSARIVAIKMKSFITISLSLVLICGAMAQRGSYAGSRPIQNGNKGPFPMQSSNTNNNFNSNNNNGISNRFGGSDSSKQQHIPVDALGDYNLVNKLSQRPQHLQPFWLLNWQAIEAHRNNPQLSASPVVSRGSFSGLWSFLTRNPQRVMLVLMRTVLWLPLRVGIEVEIKFC